MSRSRDNPRPETWEPSSVCRPGHMSMSKLTSAWWICHLNAFNSSRLLSQQLYPYVCSLNGDLKAFRCCCLNPAQSIEFNMDRYRLKLKWQWIHQMTFNPFAWLKFSTLCHWRQAHLCHSLCVWVCVWVWRCTIFTLLVVFGNTRHLCVRVVGGGVCGGVWGAFTRALINVSNVPGISFLRRSLLDIFLVFVLHSFFWLFL